MPDVVLFSPLPVEACRSRLEDATLPSRGSPVAGRVRRCTIELWRLRSVWRLFQPTLIIRLFEAGERTRLETQMRISASGLNSLLFFALFVGVNLGLFGRLWALWLVPAIAVSVFATVRARNGKKARGDGPFLREQLERLVHASAPTG